MSRIDLESRYLAVDEPETDDFHFAARRIPSDTAETTFRLPQARRDAEWLVHNWEAARREAERFGRGFVLVFDEIQKINRWSETVKGLWDADRASGCPLHVIILGSAPPIPARSSRTPRCSANFRVVATRPPWRAISTCSPTPAY